MSKYQYNVNGVNYDVEIEDIQGNIAVVNVNGRTFEVEMKHATKKNAAATHVEAPKPKVSVAAPTPAAAPVAPKPAPSPAAAGTGTKVFAPLPGTITEVKVAVGQTVKEGETVVILEAMKMQNNIEAEASGTITSVLVSKGDTVMEGTALVTIG